MRQTTIHHLRSTIYALTVLLTIWPVEPCKAQPIRQLKTGFEHEVNHYRWTADLEWAEQVAGWQVRLNNRFDSDAFLLQGDRFDFQDENELNWSISRPLGAPLTARLRGRTIWFSQSRVLSQEAYAALRYAPRPFLQVEPALGVAWDRRPGAAVNPNTTPTPLRRDVGPAYGLRLAFAPPSLGGYDLNLRGRGAWQVINPRRGRTLRLTGTAERAFENVHVNADVHVGSFRRDTYQAVSFLNRAEQNQPSETIETTTSDTLQANLRVWAPVYRHVRLTGRLTLDAQRRRIRALDAPQDALFFNTSFNRRAYDAEVALRYDADPLEGRLALRTGAEADQRQLTNRATLPDVQAAQKSNLLRQADYDEGYLTLAARLRAPLLSRFVLRFEGTANILRHDTPEINPDDRDEAYYNGQLGVLWHLSRRLEADVSLYGSTYHTVYLRAQRSAENNRQQALRLRPTVRWTPTDRTEIRLHSEVRATYTRYDFALPGRSARDQSARELRYALHVEHDLGGGVRVLADGRFSDLRLGRLVRDRFAEIPYDTLRTYSGHLRLRAGQGLTAEVGVRFFIRSDYQRAATVAYQQATGTEARVTRPGRQWIEQIGPTCTIRWPLSGGHTLRLDGWLNFQRVRYELYGLLPPTDAARIRRAARSGRRLVIPNATLSVSWTF